MLSKTDFESWCRDIKLSGAAQELITKIRQSEPVRRVGGSYNNVVGRYPSLKMGRTIQFESHKVELPAIEKYEADEQVLEFYDQPFELSLSYRSRKGRKIHCKHVPDFLVIRKSEVGFEEWKTEKRLNQLAEKQPNHFCQDEKGQWHNPPAEVTARQYGVFYRLRLDSEINWLEYRNYQFLKGYRRNSYNFDDSVRTDLISIVAHRPGITISETLECLETALPDDIHMLLATSQLYFEHQTVSITEPSKVRLFRNSAAAEAFRLLSKPSNLPISHSLGKSNISSPSLAEFLTASPRALKIANERYRALEDYYDASKQGVPDVSSRTLRRWARKFKDAQAAYGAGYIGLLPHHSAKGNSTARIKKEDWDFIDTIIKDHYETLQQKGKMCVYGIVLREWEKSNRLGTCPSHKAFYNHLKKENCYEVLKKRKGQKAAYQQAKFYWEITFTTPRHGDRPFEICHIDHTELDIELVCSRTGKNLGRPWATVLLDAFSRRVLAVYLTFDSPSYRSCMMILRICVQRFGRFPETVVVDKGSEFNSVYFETLLATFNSTKKQRPSARPRYGSIIERFFGTTHSEFIYSLSGNTQMTKSVRQVTQKNSPQQLAVWTLHELYLACSEYVYNIYDQLPHPALGESPRTAFAAGNTQAGLRPQQQIEYNLDFQILTFPSTLKGTAKVRANQGIRINYLDYWAIDESFISPDIEGLNVPVRYDPFDVSTAYAFVKGRWVRCVSEYQGLFQGRSEQEIKVITTELRQQRRLHTRSLSFRAKTIAYYLDSSELSESAQRQRLKDLASSDVHQLIDIDFTSQNSQTLNSNESAQDREDSQNDIHKSQIYKLALELDPKHISPYGNEELWV